jgi:hypothetical protein
VTTVNRRHDGVVQPAWCTLWRRPACLAGVVNAAVKQEGEPVTSPCRPGFRTCDAGCGADRSPGDRHRSFKEFGVGRSPGGRRRTPLSLDLARRAAGRERPAKRARRRAGRNHSARTQENIPTNCLAGLDGMFSALSAENRPPARGQAALGMFSPPRGACANVPPDALSDPRGILAPVDGANVPLAAPAPFDGTFAQTR